MATRRSSGRATRRDSHPALPAPSATASYGRARTRSRSLLAESVMPIRWRPWSTPIRSAWKPRSGPGSARCESRRRLRVIWLAGRSGVGSAGVRPDSKRGPARLMSTPESWRRCCWRAWRNPRPTRSSLGLRLFHQENRAAAAVYGCHGAALHAAHESPAAPVGRLDGHFPKAVRIRDRLIDGRHQRADGQPDIEAVQRVAHRLARPHAPQLLRLLVPELNTEVLVEDGDARPDVGQDLFHENVDVVQLRSPLLQFGVDRLQLGIGRLELLVHGLEFLIAGLQLFVGGLELLDGGLQLLVSGLQLLIGRLQLLGGRFQLLLGALQFAIDPVVPGDVGERDTGAQQAAISVDQQSHVDIEILDVTVWGPALDVACFQRPPVSVGLVDQGPQFHRPVRDLEIS